jgi:hypothetical protein
MPSPKSGILKKTMVQGALHDPPVALLRTGAAETSPADADAKRRLLLQPRARVKTPSVNIDKYLSIKIIRYYHLARLWLWPRRATADSPVRQRRRTDAFKTNSTLALALGGRFWYLKHRSHLNMGH